MSRLKKTESWEAVLINPCKTFFAIWTLLGVLTLSVGTIHAVTVTAPGDIAVHAVDGSGTLVSNPTIQSFLNSATAQGSIVNNLVTLDPHIEIAVDPTPVPNGSAGTFTISPTFTNTESINAIQHPFFEVTDVSGGNVLINSDGPSGVGSTVAPEIEGAVLPRGQSVTVKFVIGLQALRPFTFFMDMKEGTLSYSQNAPRVFPAGPTPVTFSAIDAAGISGMASGTVIVLPIINPDNCSADGRTN